MWLIEWQEHDAKATFFVTGNNLGKGQINDPDTPWPSLLKVRMMLPPLETPAFKCGN